MKKARSTSELIRLWGSLWEAWEISRDPTGPVPHLLQSERTRGASTKERILALPARLVVAAPLWVDSTDPEVISASIELELEVRGLLPRKKQVDAICSRTLEINGRTLVLGAIFPAETPEPPIRKNFTHFEASPLLIAAVTDGVTLWREESDLVAAFTRGPQVVFWATMDWPANSQEVRGWLNILILHLTATGILDWPPQRVHLDMTLENEALTDLIPRVPQTTSLLLPTLNFANCQWKPETTRQREHLALSSLKIRQIASAAVGIYLMLAVAIGGYLGWLGWKTRELENQIKNLEDATAEFYPTLRDWRFIGPGAETAYFPIEILHRLVGNLPPTGIRLTLYDLSAGRVTIEGEATSASLAAQFFTSVSHDADLQVMNWQMPTPLLLPSNAARFQLSGVVP